MMDVILLEKIKHLGDLGDAVSVKPGFGRNYLIPSGKAIYATEENIQQFAQRRALLEKQQKGNLAAAEARAEQLSVITIDIAKHAREEGELFGSVSAMDIVKAVTAAGIALSKNEIIFRDGPLNKIGLHQVDLKLHVDVTTVLQVNVIKE